jgi:RecJ-like exonuclease
LGRDEIKKFQREAEGAAAFLKAYLTGESRVKMISHNDADGIAAASVLARCFFTYNVPFHARFTRPLDSPKIAELGKENYDLFIFIDQGTGQIDAIHRFLLEKGRDVLILDHHPGEFSEHPNLAYLNPHLFGLNGAKDISAAGIAYSIVERIDRGFRPLVGLAVIGAIGDRQEFFSGFAGVNEALVKRAVDLGFLNLSEGLKLIGRDLYPVKECLRLSVRPYLPNISGNPAASEALVERLGIKKGLKISDLDGGAERKLKEALSAQAGSAATLEEFRRTLWGAIYTFTKDRLVGPRDVYEYVMMLEACGKLRKPEVGFAATMGDQSVKNEALSLLKSYQEQMVEVLSWLVKHMDAFKLTRRMRYIYAGDAIKPQMIGEALSLAIESGLLEADRPIIGIADISTEIIKVSARATPNLAMRGVNVGRVIRKVADAVGGTGGGHDVSAAAWVPRERMDEFIAKLDQSFEGPDN